MTIQSDYDTAIRTFREEWQRITIRAMREAFGMIDAPAAPKAAPTTEPKRKFGAKRDPAELAALTDALGDYISKHPGMRIEEIGAALQLPTKDLVLPVQKLLAAKRIKRTGTRRATKYFPR